MSRGETMIRDVPPPPALTLLILLRRAGWSQNELADALKMKPETVSAWIRTGKGLDRKLLEEITRLIGFEVREIDRTLDYLAGRNPGEDEEIPGYAGLSPYERRVVREARARVVQNALEALDAELPRHVEEARVRRARAEAEEHWKTLKALPAEERRRLIDQTPESCAPALVARVCAESLRAAAHKADRALGLAKLALYIAEHVPGDVSLRCQAYAQGFVANALRVMSQLNAASALFAERHKLWDSGTASDPALSEACLLGLEASLCRNQRRFDEAFALLGRALALEDPREMVNLLIEKSHLQHTKGRYQEAIDTLREAEVLLDPEREPQHWFAVQFNKTANFCRLGQHQEAKKILPTLWDLSLGGDLHLLRLRWLAAEVNAGCGDEEAAVRSLKEVRKEFADLEIPFDAALVSLDLAEIYLKQSRWREVRSLSEEMIQLFRNLGVHREAIASLLLFRESVEREDATVELIRRLAQYLREAEHDPAHRFEG